MNATDPSLRVNGEIGALLHYVAGPVTIQQQCPGPDHCPHRRDEAALQKRFEENTGISCCQGEREALEHLLEQHQFERKQLLLARRSGALYWDSKAERLRAVVSRPDFFWGWSTVVVAVYMVAIFVAQYLLEQPPLTLIESTKFFAVLLGFFSMIPAAEKFLIRPNRIAMRAAPILEEYYQEDGARHRKVENGAVAL